MKDRQRGFAALEALLILVILALIGFVGYKVYSTKTSTDTSYNKAAQSQSVTQSSTAVPEVNKASDLNKAQKALDQVNPDEDSGSDSQISGSY